jgi:hypothetical protein
MPKLPSAKSLRNLTLDYIVNSVEQVFTPKEIPRHLLDENGWCENYSANVSTVDCQILLEMLCQRNDLKDKRDLDQLVSPVSQLFVFCIFRFRLYD